MFNTNLKEITMVLLLTLLINSCGIRSTQVDSNESDSLGYEISEKVFEDVSESGLINVILKYPQIINLSDKQIMDKVNKQIEKSAKHDYTNEENKEKNGLNLKLEYAITYVAKNIISIKFYGELYRDPSRFMHIYPILYTININLKTGESFKLSDLYKETFCNSINVETFHYDGTDKDATDDPESFAYYVAHENTKVTSRIFNLFCDSKDWDTLHENDFYLKKEGLCIIMFFPGGSGTFFEFKTSYDNLKEHINKDKSLWLEIY